MQESGVTIEEDRDTYLQVFDYVRHDTVPCNTLTPIQRGEGALSALRSPGGDAWRRGRDARRGPSDPAQEVDPGCSLVILQINPSVCF